MRSGATTSLIDSTIRLRWCHWHHVVNIHMRCWYRVQTGQLELHEVCIVRQRFEEVMLDVARVTVVVVPLNGHLVKRRRMVCKGLP